MEKQKPQKKGFFNGILNNIADQSTDYVNQKINERPKKPQVEKVPSGLVDPKNEIWIDIMKSVGKKMKNLDLKNRKRDSLYDNVVEQRRNEEMQKKREEEQIQREKEEMEILPHEERNLLVQLEESLEIRRNNKVLPKKEAPKQNPKDDPQKKISQFRKPVLLRPREQTTDDDSEDENEQTEQIETPNNNLFIQSLETLYQTIPKLLPMKEKMVSVLDDMKIINKRMNNRNREQMTSDFSDLLVVLEEQIIICFKKHISQLYADSKTLEIVYVDTIGKDRSKLFEHVGTFSQDMEYIYEGVKEDILDSIERIDDLQNTIQYKPENLIIQPTLKYFSELFSQMCKLIDELRDYVVQIRLIVK